MAARLYEAYSLLFLYTGSCSAEHYAATVRVDMMSCDPAFSGLWARDYEMIPGLLRHIRNTHPAAAIAPLREAAKANHRVHMAVAKKLVPDGGSLLRDAGRRPQGPTEAERVAYDAFFQVERRPLCRRAFTAQLVRRFAQVMSDIAVHGLSGPDSPPALLDATLRDAFAEFEEKAGDLLLGIAEAVASQDSVAEKIVAQRAGGAPSFALPMKGRP